MEIIKLNLIPSGVNPTCHCSQYDNGRVIRIDLFDGLTPYVLQSGDTVTLNVRKPDNTIVTASLTATQGNTYVNLVTTEQICACVGYNLCDLTIENGSKKIGTLNFIMQIERDVLADGIPSQSQIDDLDELVQEAVGDNYYTKSETNDLLDGKADSDEVYTKTEIDNSLNLKADKTDITEINGQLSQAGVKHIQGTKVNGYIASSTGKINSGNNYRSKYIPIQAGKGYKFYSTGNRLIYGLYFSVSTDSYPFRNLYFSDTDHASTEHYIYNGVGAQYLFVYYNQGADDTVDAVIYEDSAVKDNYDDIKSLNDLYFKDEALLDGIVQKGYIAANTGILNNGTDYRNKIYYVEPNKTYKISTSGNRLVAGFYSSANTGTEADYYVQADKSDTIYLKNTTSSPYLVVYYYTGSTEPTTEDATVYLVKDEPLKHLNVCIFGNSYAADAWGYVPFILKKYGITTNIYMYYRGSGSPSRLVAEWEDNSETGLDIYGNPHIRRMTHIDTRVMSAWEDAVQGYSAKNIVEFANDNTKNIGEWDIITLQLVSSEQYPDGQGGYTMRNGIEPALRQVINLINQSYTKNYCLGFFETYNRIKSIGGIPIEDLDDRIETMTANEAAYRAEPFGLLLPVGAAVFSARTNGLLASLDVSDIGNLWSDDKTHLQEGLPCYIAALTICQAIFKKYGLPFSVLGDDTRITSALINSWNVQFQNGTPKEVGELYYQLGQKCAVVANDSPFDITPIYAPDETDEVIYNRSKYWADGLIDTSNIT